MITFELRFDDGEHICYKDTLQEAREYRSENNFKYISRSIHIYARCKSRVRGCKLYYPKTIKLV
jgi:hypothetical protein